MGTGDTDMEVLILPELPGADSVKEAIRTLEQLEKYNNAMQDKELPGSAVAIAGALTYMREMRSAMAARRYAHLKATERK